MFDKLPLSENILTKNNKHGTPFSIKILLL